MCPITSQDPIQRPVTDGSSVGPNLAAPLPVSPTFDILCIKAGEDTPFAVTIGFDAAVYQLKTAIKAEIRSFAEIDAHLLDLYLVNLPDDDELTSGIEDFLRNPTTRLRATKRISSLKIIRKEDLVHILVRPRQNGERTTQKVH